jgi:HK97 family phage major capsid protein
MSTLLSLRQALGTAVDELATLSGDAKAYAAKEKECDSLETHIRNLEAAQRRSAALAKPVLGGGADPTDVSDINPSQRTLSQVRAMDPRPGRLKGFEDYLALARKGFEFTPRADTGFRSLGEQLQSVFKHYMSKGSDTDNRLVRAPTGASEVDPTGGGFLVQIDFAASIFMLAHDMGEILSRVSKLPISANANGIKIPGVDETSRATGSRWGGVASYWVGEGTSVTPTKPKFRVIEFDLKKLMSVMYTTDELLQDSTALTSIAATAFSEEIMFMTEDAIFEGKGAGIPLGVMNSPALITLPIQTGQATKTIVKENIDGMWARMWARSMRNATWFINQDALPQLMQMNQAVGTGGQLVYLPPGGLSGTPYSTLYGREVVWTEYNSTLGTVGDILLADLSQYMLVDKNGVQAATSMHVAFLTDEMVFRITYRVDGKPMWSLPLTPFKGANTKSPFIALASR